MANYYLLQNQLGQFLFKSGEWHHPKQNDKSLYSSVHKDEAINTKIELTVKNAELRIKLVETTLNDKGLPIVPAYEMVHLTTPITQQNDTNSNQEQPDCV